MTSGQRFLVYLAVASLVTGLYLAWSSVVYRPGFPLDDAWIHQVYARSLARDGQWAFQPGEVSTGSTAPLWSAWMALGQLAGINPVAWSAVVGALTLAVLAETAARGMGQLLPGRKAWAFGAGLLIVAEWHLVWAAGSGMETLAFAALALAVLVQLLQPSPAWFRLGLLVGLSIWLRPDGLTLLGPVGWTLLFRKAEGRSRRVAAAHFLLGFVLPAGLYAAFHWRLAGSFWPNTYFAKQAEYASLRAAPYLNRLAAMASPLLAGAAALLVPGALWELVRRLRGRQWAAAAGLLWAFGLVGLYAWRLPAAYQHGRYVMPALPVLVLWGAAGMAALARPGAAQFRVRVISRTWITAAACVAGVFLLVGGQAFARDVAVIESEMVATALWVVDQTDPEAVLAAHDIGALGYFSERRLVDLAGLVSPEVIPFLRDEAALADFIDRAGAGYLVTLQGWYPRLEADKTPVFTTGSPFSPALGGTNMVVYRWP